MLTSTPPSITQRSTSPHRRCTLNCILLCWLSVLFVTSGNRIFRTGTPITPAVICRMQMVSSKAHRIVFRYMIKSDTHAFNLLLHYMYAMREKHPCSRSSPPNSNWFARQHHWFRERELCAEPTAPIQPCPCCHVGQFVIRKRSNGWGKVRHLSAFG